VVESAGTVIDGRLQKRWARAIGRLGQTLSLEDAARDDA
jgi:flagellar assembly protein FliH